MVMRGTINPIVLVLLVRSPDAIILRLYPTFSTIVNTLLRVDVCTCGWLFNTREIVAGDNCNAFASSWIEFFLFGFAFFMLTFISNGEQSDFEIWGFGDLGILKNRTRFNAKSINREIPKS